MRVWFVNDSGPLVAGGHHTYPGLANTFRVDSGTPRELTGNGAAIVADMLKGRTVFIEYYKWPSSVPRQMEVPLAGFPQAYALLRKKVSQ